ncbi:MAG: hypothetical protein U9N48_04840 [Euryarchaeota archaeon]|nr:hypothetical protein [Euryarchaeota archaeon]
MYYKKRPRVLVPNSTEALEKVLLFVISEPNTWRDPHGLIAVGCLKLFIIEHFGAETYEDWLADVSAGICLSSDSRGVAVDAHDYPDYPEDLADWLKYHPDQDQYSIGIRVQALLYGGVSPNETWDTADGWRVSTGSLTYEAIREWKSERDDENLSSGDLPKDLLLHLAPTLIVFKQKYPQEFVGRGYDEALDERVPKSMKGLEYMIDDQAPSGKFNLSNNNYLGAQVHGMKGLYRCMQVFGFDY